MFLHLRLISENAPNFRMYHIVIYLEPSYSECRYMYYQCGCFSTRHLSLPLPVSAMNLSRVLHVAL